MNWLPLVLLYQLADLPQRWPGQALPGSPQAPTGSCAQVEKERETVGQEAQQAKARLEEAESSLATHKAEAKRLAEMLQGADQARPAPA